MLKRKLNKAAFEALSKDLQVFYKLVGDDYELQMEVSADDDPGELRRALAREKQSAKDEKARADRLQGEMDLLVADPNKLKDIKTLETSWQNKLNDQKAADKKLVDRLTDQLKKTLVKDKARELATTLAGDSANLLLPHIEARLQADLEGDMPSTRVLDKDGKISALTIEDLQKEFVANKDYSAIIIASRASGGAGGKNNGTSAVPNGKKFNELTDVERTEWHKRDPEGFIKASKENAQAQRKF